MAKFQTLGQFLQELEFAQELVEFVTKDGPGKPESHMERLNQLVKASLKANKHTGDIAGDFLGFNYDLRIPEAMLSALPRDVAATYQRQT